MSSDETVLYIRHLQSSVHVERRSDNSRRRDGVPLPFAAASTALRSDSGRRPRALNTGAASAPYAAAYFKRLPP